MKNKRGQTQGIQQPVKKSKLWLWILYNMIAIVVIAIGIGIYFLLASGNGSPVVGGGNSIPQPPALPE
jgi:flagellar basal body-associated protein FliL|tara:strand:+ start:1611 stop:1814 length:204 start_codon:yes stop_codon:yes gene_type:complete